MSKKQTTAVVWFRRDLRLDDNPALHAATDEYDRVIPLFIDDSAEETEWAPGAVTQWWLHHSLTALRQSLESAGATLIIRRGNAHEIIHEIVKTANADAVFWNRLYEPFAITRDKAIKQSLRDNDIHVRSFNASLLIEPWEVETKTETPYRVFTPFWREAQKRLNLGTPPDAPRSLKSSASNLPSDSLDSLNLLPKISWDAGIAEAWTPGESGARASANAFVKETVRRYDEQRDFPSIDGVSRLSPHLHFGELSVRRLYQAIIDKHGKEDDGSRIYLSELGWREFSHHILFHYPETTNQPMKEKYATFPWRENTEDLVRAWQRGHTGIPIVDAGMRQLWHTGWMHNRVRMIVASFLVKNIRAHWLHGARWFWDTLADADLPANTMGWQWSAGSGADAAPYFRIFNPKTQGERFDKDGSYVRQWVPELVALPNKFLHQPWALPDDQATKLGFKIGSDYPLPVVDLSESRQAALDAFKTLKENS